MIYGTKGFARALRAHYLGHLVAGASPQGRGLEPHSCVICVLCCFLFFVCFFFCSLSGLCRGRVFFFYHKIIQSSERPDKGSHREVSSPAPGPTALCHNSLQVHGAALCKLVMEIQQTQPKRESTHRGARTHDHKVKGLALYRLS